MSEFNLQAALAAVAARRAENPTPEVVGIQIDPNSPQHRIARAQQLEADVSAQLEWLEAQPESEVTVERMHNFLDRIGELAAEQGDYERAAEVSYSPERRAYYESIVAAIEEENGATCDCPPTLEVNTANRTEFQSPAIMVVDELVSPDGGTMHLHKCRVCGFQNAF